MEKNKRRRLHTALTVFVTSFVLFLLYYVALDKLPMQELKITAVTEAESFDMYGETDVYGIKFLDAGKKYTASIRFMAVADSSDDLFAASGKGQYVYLGCSELRVDYDFISLGRYLHIRLKLSADQTGLKLEDGTPFDITRYSLRPVLSIEE